MACYSGDLVGIVAQCVVAILGLERVYMYGAVRGLRSNILIERIPCNALDVVVMFGDLTY